MNNLLIRYRTERKVRYPDTSIRAEGRAIAWTAKAVFVGGIYPMLLVDR